MHYKLNRFAILSVFLLNVLAVPSFAQEEPRLTTEQKREFLLNAKVMRARQTSTGITRPYRLTMTDGTITHDAHFQSIDEQRNYKKFGNGTVEINFRDSYRYNIAAYELSTLLGLEEMIPVTVPRKWNGISGSLSWWLPVQMDAVKRYEEKIPPPDVEAWNESMHKIRTFSELIYDTDRNLQNILIGNDWEVYMIDFTRAFRLYHDLKSPENLERCSKNLLQRLRELDAGEVEAKLGEYLSKPEIQGVMKRRDKIVTYFEKLIEEKGEYAVIF